MWSVVGQTSLWQSAQWVGFSAAWAAVRRPPDRTADSWPVTCWEDWWIDSTRDEVTTRPDCRATCASLREHLSQFSRRSIRQCVRRLCARRVHHKGGHEVSHDPKDQVTRPELSNRQRSLDKVVRRDLIRGVLSFQGTLWCFDRHLVRATSKFWATTNCKSDRWPHRKNLRRSVDECKWV